ncbi:hypothetical protein Gotur_022727 [Gossypium turneri]
MKFHILLTLFLVLFVSFLSSSNCYTFYVDWVLHPKEKYNDWAGKMRFQVNDTIIFKYEKGSDSVLLVQKDDYDKCERKQPLMEMNNGSSEFKYPHSGPFYFISGKEGHCQTGQKMITVVMAVRHGTPSIHPPTAPSPKHHGPVTPGPAHSPYHHGPVAKPPTGSSPVPALAPGPIAKPPTGSSPVPALAPGPIAKPPTALTPGPAQSPYHHGPISNPPTASSPAPYSGPALSPTHHGPSPSPTAEGPIATPPSPQAPTTPVSSPPGEAPVSGPPAPPQGPSPSSSSSPPPPAGSQTQTSTPPGGSPPKSSATSIYSSIVVLAASLLFNMVFGSLTCGF